MRSLSDLLDEINLEARSGRVNCGLIHWIYYSCCEVGNNGYNFNDVIKDYDNVIVPCLKIDNRNRLLETISEYLEIAKSFYDELDYDRVVDIDKYTISTLLSNMAIDDFNNPINFFERRCAFLQDNTLKHFKLCRDIGYSEVFDANIEVELRKESIFMETPYSLYISIIKYNKEGRKLSYPLPVLRFGIEGERAYFYAIQKDQSEEMPEDKDFLSFSKKIRRKMYAVNANLDGLEQEENDNLIEVSPWALIALTICLGILEKNGIKSIVAYPLLLNRYNANVIYSQEELKNLSDKDEDIYKDIKSHLLFISNNIDSIQENITDKFIRTFRRVGYHFPGISVNDFAVANILPLEMELIQSDFCNNSLLKEMYELGLCYNYGDVKRKVV